MAQKPSIPKGMRDFGPKEMSRRNYIFSSIKNVFEQHGFQPIETPALELITTLTGKYGDEGDQLLFKVLNSRPHEGRPEKKEQMREAFQQTLDRNTIAPVLTERAMKYDLTVPFARYVVQHRNDITFPFKRYQIQPVWRADKPQAGRYREFYQCDVDVIGSNGLWNEVELIEMIEQVFDAVQLKGIVIKLNNRKVLTGIAEVLNLTDKLIPLTVALDKIDKIGEEGVMNELRKQDFSEEAIGKLRPIVQATGSNADLLEVLKNFLASSEVGMLGVSELETILNQCEALGFQSVQLDLTLARGLNYYTGAIFEVQHPEFPSSICGGGRYDDLTGIFGMPDVSGVGVSFGADRIYDLLLQLNLYPKETQQGTQVLFVNFGDQEASYAFSKAAELRAKGIATEVYPDNSKMKKQMKYANALSIPYVALCGESELKNNTITLKNMATGEQQELSIDQVEITSN